MGFFSFAKCKKSRLLRRAHKASRSGNENQALQWVLQAKELCPNDADVFVQHAWALADMKRLDEAVAETKKGIELHPAHGVLHLILGEILYSKGDYESARQSLLRSLELTGENLRAEFSLALVYVAQGDMDKAAQYFESSVKYDKNLVQSRLLAMAERYLFEHQHRST